MKAAKVSRENQLKLITCFMEFYRHLIPGVSGGAAVRVTGGA